MKLLASLLLAVALIGCSPSLRQAQAVTAHTMAVAVNASIEQLLAEAEAREMLIVEESTTEAGANEALATERKRRGPVWDAVDVLAAAHDLWATSLEDGGMVDSRKAVAAFCELLEVAAPLLRLPDTLGLCEVAP